MSDWKNVQYKDGKMRTSEGGGGGGSSTFAGLEDVSFNNLQNGQVPKYNSTTQKWENANESGGGTVTDVQVDGASVVNPQGVAEIETPNAGGIEYDNQQSGLQATDVQSAIDELAQGSGSGGVEDVEVNGTSVVNAQNVAEIKSYKEVTQAEYNALPSSKLSDGVLYCIKDSAGADEFPPLIYSDEEREIGVWRDGKPLYQKTYSVNLTINTGVWADTGIPKGDIDRIVRTEINDANNSYGYASASIDHSNVWICPSLSNQKIITLLYTKSTDTPGSGTWMKDGTYAKHYSYDEHIIGTYADGSTLYEKTIPAFTFSSGQTTVTHNLNIDAYISITGWVCVNNDMTQKFAFPFVQNRWGGYCQPIQESANFIIIDASWSNNKAELTIQYTKKTT